MKTREQNEEKQFTRNCPKCNKELSYSTKFTLKNAEDKNSVCKSCSLIGKGTGFKKGHQIGRGKPSWNKGLKGVQVAWNKGLTKETSPSVAQYGISSGISKRGKPTWNTGLTAETDDRVAANGLLSGKTLHKRHVDGTLKSPTIRPEVRRKMRETMLRKVEEMGGFPNFNPKACEIFNEINRMMGWEGIHAMNGGEYKFIGYAVDFYEPNLNIVIEYYEKFHKSTVDRDLYRQIEIINELNCKFFIIKEWENIHWSEIINPQSL